MLRPDKAIKRSFIRTWQGEESFQIVFWLWGVVGCTAWVLLNCFVFVPSIWLLEKYSRQNIPEYSDTLIATLFLLFIPLFHAYLVLSVVLVWRGAAACMHAVAKWFMRIFVVGIFLLWIAWVSFFAYFVFYVSS